MYRVYLDLDADDGKLVHAAVLATAPTEAEAREIMNRTVHDLQRDRGIYVFDQEYEYLLMLGKRRTVPGVEDRIEVIGGVYYLEGGNG